MNQIAFDFSAATREPVYDYSWQVQCTHHKIDERTGEPYRWTLGASGRDDAERVAARVRELHPGVRAEVERRRAA